MSKPVLALIVAMDRHRVIGFRGSLPWNLPEDLKLFRKLTTGNTVIMGRKTFDALGKPLPNRHNIVLSGTLAEQADVVVCRTFPAALAEAWRIGRPVFFIGGAAIYRKAIAIVDELHISWVKGEYRGDTWFPEIDFSNWRAVEEQEFADFRYQKYLRKTGQSEP